MHGIHHGAWTGRIEGDFVVVLFGLRVNSWWRLGDRRWARRVLAELMAELEGAPAYGLLGYESFRGNPSLLVQYWRSFAHLERWSRERGGRHRAVWTRYGREFEARAAIGVFHETYVVHPGGYETVYTNMPRFGLAAVGEHLKAEGRLATASGRMREGAEDESTGVVP